MLKLRSFFRNDSLFSRIKNHQNKMKKALRKLTMFSIFKKSLTKPELLWEGVRTHLLDGG